MDRSTGSDRRIYGLRHGQSLANVAGIIVSDPRVAIRQYGLSVRGQEQIRARAAASGLSPETVIICSPFLRTVETARLFGDVIGASDPLPDERLRERFFGDFDGGSDRHYADVWAADRTNPHHEQWRAESAASVWQRFHSLWLECRDRPDGRDILFVTHGDLLSIGTCGLRREPLSKHQPGFAAQTGELRLLGPQRD